MLNQRQLAILEFIKTNKSATREQVQTHISNLFDKSSKITLLRDLDKLIDDSLIVKSGKTKSAEYSISPKTQLLDTVDVEAYFDIDPDKRELINDKVKNNVKLSEADYQIELLSFKDSVTEALNETAYYAYAYSKSAETLDYTKSKFADTQTQTKYYQDRYEAGKVELKDFLEALNSQNSAQTELLKQKYMVVKYENYVYKALAGKYNQR